MKGHRKKGKRYFKKSLRLKLIAMAVIPVILAQVAVGAVNFFAYNKVVTGLIVKRDKRLASLTAEQVSTLLTEDLQRFERIAEEILDDSKGTFTAPKNTIAWGDGNVTVALDANGVVLRTMPEVSDFIGADWSNLADFKQAMQSLEPGISDVITDFESGTDVVIITYPVVDAQDDFKGLIMEITPVGEEKEGRLYEELETLLQVEENNAIYLVDSQGRVIYHSQTQYIGKDFSSQDAVDELLEGDEAAERMDDVEGQRTISAFALVPGTSWGLVIEDNWTALIRDMRGYQAILLVLLSLGAIAPAFVVAAGVKHIACPIEALTKAAQEVAEGDFNQTIEVETDDEIEELARQFNQMSARLRDSYAHLEQRVAERTAQLAAANERYRAVSELTSDYIYHLTITDEGEFVLDWATDAFARLTGYDLSELTEQDGWLGIIHPEDLSHYQAQRNALLAMEPPPDGELSLTPVVFEYRIMAHGNGARPDEVRWLRDYWRPMWDVEQGRVTHILGASQDITADKQVEQALLRAKETAESANRAKSVFLANMSHELRTPLNAILGYSQLMSRAPDVTSEQQEYLETIGRSGEHLLGLINDVLIMSKIEAGRTALQENAFDLHRQLEGLAEMFQMRADAKDLALILDITPDVPQYIYADEGKLRQVLMNLLSNAVKFTDDGGVTLRVDRRATEAEVAATTTDIQTLVFEVEDTGAGIAPDEMEILFDPFVQTSSGHNSKEGTGLGLPISRQFVTLMGGTLTVDSQVGQGTRFRIQVPVKLAAEDEVEMRELQPRRRVTGIEAGQYAPDGGPYRILVVEDRATNRDLLVKLLTPFGFDVQCAVNGQEGVEVWEEWDPHLIWMDMRMPVMDGYEASREIKAQAAATGREAIIVALTASAFEEDREAIMAAGCDDFVRKPFREAEIFEALTKHLGIRFIYETPEASPDTEALEPQVEEELTPEVLNRMLQDLPTEWADALHQATTQLDADQMLSLIEEIQPRAPRLADTLTQWVNDFEYEQIMTLTQGA